MFGPLLVKPVHMSRKPPGGGEYHLGRWHAGENEFQRVHAPGEENGICWHVVAERNEYAVDVEEDDGGHDLSMIDLRGLSRLVFTVGDLAFNLPPASYESPDEFLDATTELVEPTQTDATGNPADGCEAGRPDGGVPAQAIEKGGKLSDSKPGGAGRLMRTAISPFATQTQMFL